MPPSGPGDFCAWFEADREGRWYTFDARYNSPRVGSVLMVRGRDADGAMMTSFGSYELKLFRVWTDEVTAMVSGDDVSGLLENGTTSDYLDPGKGSSLVSLACLLLALGGGCRRPGAPV